MTPGLGRRLAGLAIAALVARRERGRRWPRRRRSLAPKAPVPPPPFATPHGPSEAGVRWQSLTPAQRQALAPLERDWSGIDAQRKQKWLQIADRYPSLPPQEQARIAERMNEWARLTPAERGEMRLRYQEAKQVPAPDRSAKWQEYQNLTPDAKQQFAARAAASAAPAKADPLPGAKAARHGREGSQAKANVVPNPTAGAAAEAGRADDGPGRAGRDHPLHHPPGHAAGASAVGHAQDHGHARVREPLHPAAASADRRPRPSSRCRRPSPGVRPAPRPPSRPSPKPAR